jgi:arginyl-tRNA synthetase
VIRNRIAIDLQKTLSALGIESPVQPAVGPAAQPQFGDFSTNIALQLAGPLKQPPRKIAERIAAAFHSPWVARVEVAGPGFINFHLAPYGVFQTLAAARQGDPVFWKPDVGQGTRVLLEFVSANPTHPLHVGHGRGAVYGDVLGSILARVGFSVWREYYVNDVGKQVDHLGRSLYHRYRALCGIEEPFPDECYQGQYVRDIASEYFAEKGPVNRDAAYEAVKDELVEYIGSRLLSGIREDVSLFRIDFDRWYSEREIYQTGLFERVMNRLRQDGWLYEQDGKLVFRTSVVGDDEDRVVVRENGIPTYFCSDISYHYDKFERGFDLLIDIWGADHHGYVPRMKASIQALGQDPEKFKVILLQFVRLLRNGVPAPMSGRAGNFVTVREVLDEVGVDATRFFFLLRSGDAPLDFDLELAKKQSIENPVYYVQYGHARICSILAKAAERGHVPGDLDPADLEAVLTLPEEVALAKKLLEYPVVLTAIGRSFEIHQLAFYLIDLNKLFHSYYQRYKGSERIVSDDEVKTRARLYLVSMMRDVLRDALEVLKVSAPERMTTAGGGDEEP